MRAARPASGVRGADVAWRRRGARQRQRLMAWALRNLFNRPEIIALVRATTDERLLAGRPSARGHRRSAKRPRRVRARAQSSRLESRSGPSNPARADRPRDRRGAVDAHVGQQRRPTSSVRAGEVTIEVQRMRSHFAVRFGRGVSRGRRREQREGQVRTCVQLAVLAVRARLDVGRPGRAGLPPVQPRDRALEPPGQPRRPRAARGTRPPLQGPRRA